jgi:hypothetical protein
LENVLSRWRILGLLLLSLSSGCGRSSGDLFDAMMKADDNEQIRFISAEIMDQGADGIPILLAILSRDVPPDRRLSLIELSKDGAALAPERSRGQRSLHHP